VPEISPKVCPKTEAAAKIASSRSLPIPPNIDALS
jgi:hypothetical protein